MPIILELRRLRQQDCFTFKTNLNYCETVSNNTFLVGSRVHILRLTGPVYLWERWSARLRSKPWDAWHM